MHWRWLFFSLIIVGCTFELAPLEQKKPGPSGGAGGTGNIGGLQDAGCTTIGCSTGGGGSGGTGTGATGNSSGTGASGGTGGTTPTFSCTDVATIQYNCWARDQGSCSCLGCDPTYCSDPNNGDPVSDCVCPTCWGDPYCAPSYCQDDGICDPLGEGCQCADCAMHPACSL